MIVAALVAILLLATGGEALAQSPEERWLQATEVMAAGDDAQAVALLRTLIREHPQSDLTDDALFLAASLLEEKLGDPVQASQLYRTLSETFPDSRSALAAQRRLERLEIGLGPKGEGSRPLAAFQDLLYRYPERGADRSLALAEKLLQEYPQWSGAYRVRLWMADNRRRLGDYREAALLFEKVRESGPESARMQAGLGAADVEILRGEYARATRLLDRLEAQPDRKASDTQALRELQMRAREGAARQIRVSASYFLFAAMLVLLLGAARKRSASWGHFFRQLRVPPIEVIYMGPIALLFVAMAAAGHQEIGPAVNLIAVGGILITWSCANALRGPKALRLPYALLCSFAATLATLSLCYVALHRSQLLELLYTTISFGPE